MGSRRVFTPGVPAAESFGRLTSAGFAVAAIDYRLTGEAIFPAQLDDVRAALSWVQDQGTAQGIDPSRIVLWGESAGGHLAALAGLDNQAGVRGVVDWYGPADLASFPAPDAQTERPTREEQLIGGPVETHRPTAIEASTAFARRCT
ncbi:alpha/beta hydrolase fold domain-containing protein [Microbacterium amylolyticum]|uniref:alpha/beta hydrolase fold domain-containing protein n=1 Tax=Microbacterium amylolyticum TaxID=936337 RepID=UPI0013EB1C13